MTLCSQKKGYPSQRMAETVKRKRERDNRTIVLRTYLCPDFGRWHLTSRPEWDELKEVS